MRRHKVVAALVGIFFLCLFAAGDIYSQYSSNENKAIAAIKVKNNKAISTETVLAKIRSKVGDKFSQEVLNEDLNDKEPGKNIDSDLHQDRRM